MRTLFIRCEHEHFYGVMAVPLTDGLMQNMKLLTATVAAVKTTHDDLYCISLWGVFDVYEDIDIGDYLSPEDDDDVEWAVADPGSPETTPASPARTECDQMHIHADGHVHWSFIPKHSSFEVETASVDLLGILMTEGF